MLSDIARLLIGGLMLYFGAEWLVRGAAGLARAFGVPPLVIGLTVVSYGTSAPELAVSVAAALDGKSDIAVGNVVGSNVANIGLILGITALIAPPKVDPTLIRREIPWLMLATFAVPLIMLGGQIGRIEGALLTFGAVAFTWLTLKGARQGEGEQAELEDIDESRGRLALLGFFAVGLAVLVRGGDVFVDGAVGVATRYGMSERVIGLTIVAVGTSLPELAASLVAALRGHSELAVGNVVGSNLFNILLILGVTSLVRPIPTGFAGVPVDLLMLG
ncbi:MAG: calcium/sodium antiporter, partial [Myxococcales bacterium]|nr:calcium/sodium antiporter [Myxococcales bacterium]